MSLDRDARVLAHTTDVDTSHTAARAPGKATNRYWVLKLYERGPVSSFHAWLSQAVHDDEGFDLAEVRRRSTDLLQMGYLKRTGLKAWIASTGKEAHVLKLTPGGEALLVELRRDVPFAPAPAGAEDRCF